MIEPKIGDRVRWRWPETGASEDELNGEILAIKPRFIVRFDDGSTDECNRDDFILADASKES